MKSALVVGGSKGIGRATVDLLRQDYSITVLSRTNLDLPSDVHFIEGDATLIDWSDVELPSKLDALVYCPGTINLKSFRSLKEKDFQEDFAVNVMGAIKTLKATERSLKQSDGPASVVLYSTVAVSQGMPFHASVSASKGALEGLCRSLAAEWAPHVRINCVAPSLTDTPLAGAILSSDEKKEKANSRNPMKRIGKPEDIAEATRYLLSDQASWITGQVIPVDGGHGILRV